MKTEWNCLTLLNIKLTKSSFFFQAFVWPILSVSVFKSQIIPLSVQKIALKGSCCQEGHWSSWSERVAVASPLGVCSDQLPRCPPLPPKWGCQPAAPRHATETAFVWLDLPGYDVRPLFVPSFTELHLPPETWPFRYGKTLFGQWTNQEPRCPSNPLRTSAQDSFVRGSHLKLWGPFKTQMVDSVF